MARRPPGGRGPPRPFPGRREAKNRSSAPPGRLGGVGVDGGSGEDPYGAYGAKGGAPGVLGPAGGAAWTVALDLFDSYLEPAS